MSRLTIELIKSIRLPLDDARRNPRCDLGVKDTFRPFLASLCDERSVEKINRNQLCITRS